MTSSKLTTIDKILFQDTDLPRPRPTNIGGLYPREHALARPGRQGRTNEITVVMGKAMTGLRSSGSYGISTRSGLGVAQHTIAIPHTNTIKGSHRDGRRCFKARLLGTYQTSSVKSFMVRGEAPHLQQSIGKEKRRERRKILPIRHMKTPLHVIQL